MKNMQLKKGFTLIELMIVAAIVAILAAIAYPSYTQYVMRSKRADAAGDLLELSQFLERYYTENGRYDEDTGGTAMTLPYDQSPESGDAAYNISTTTLTDTTFTLQALPNGGQASDPCGTLTLDNAGTRCINGDTIGCSDSGDAAISSEVAACW